MSDETSDPVEPGVGWESGLGGVPESQEDIPTEFKGSRRPVVYRGARVAITKHARLRYWQRLRTHVTDQEIMEAAARALDEGDGRFRFTATVYDNPHRPTVLRLITVLRRGMRIPSFFVKFEFERDEKWHAHLRNEAPVMAGPLSAIRR